MRNTHYCLRSSKGALTIAQGAPAENAGAQAFASITADAARVLSVSAPPSVSRRRSQDASCRGWALCQHSRRGSACGPRLLMQRAMQAQDASVAPRQGMPSEESEAMIDPSMW
jgi:hypothetical protein